MNEPEFVDVWEGPTVADLAYINALERNGDGPEEDSWLPLNLADIADEPPVRPTLGGVGIVYPGKRHVFSGPQESAKTLAAYVIALQVIREGGRVVLLDFEMGAWDTKTRLRELGATVPELAELAYVEPAEPARPDAIARLVGLAPALVVLDAAAGAYQLEGLDDNKRGDVERFAAIYVRAFWRAGIATILLDHVTKNAETRGSYAIGSERKVGGADVHLGFEVVTPIKRGGTGLYKVTTHKDRGGFLRRGKLAEFHLHSDPDTHAISWELRPAEEAHGDEHEFRPTHLMEKVSRWLELQQSPVSRNEVEKAVEGKGQYVREALDILTREAWISETKGAKRARLVESVRAYREADDDTSSSSSPLRPSSSPEGGNFSSSVRPSPYGGDERDEFVPRDELSSSQGTLDEADPLHEDPGF